MTQEESNRPRLRLYTEQPLKAGAQLELTADQRHYLVNVMRSSTGDTVALFNGRDGEWAAELTEIAKKSARVGLLRQLKLQDTVPDLWFLFAPVKRVRLDFLVQKATELGVDVIWPLTTERTNVARVNLERLRANCAEAAEQTGRLSIPRVREPDRLRRVLAEWDEGRSLLFCDEAGDNPEQEWGGEAGRAAPIERVLNDQKAEGNRGKWAVLVGPEGGFTPQERETLRSHSFVFPVSLGPRIMRADTAAVAVLSIWQSILGDWSST